MFSVFFRGVDFDKRKGTVVEKFNFALQEFKDYLIKLENFGGSEDLKVASASGRRVYETAKGPLSDVGNKVKLDKIYGVMGWITEDKVEITTLEIFCFVIN